MSKANLCGCNEADKSMEHHQNRLQDYRRLRRFQCELCHNSEMSVEQIETRYVKQRLREHLSITPEKSYFYKELAPARIKTDLGPVEKVVDLLQNVFSTIPRRKRGRSYKSVYRLVLQQLQKYAMICFKPERRGMGAVGWR